MKKPASAQRASRTIVATASAATAHDDRPAASPTIADACASLEAAQTNAATAARYRWLLSPLVDRCGSWSPQELARDWAAVAGELEQAQGEKRLREIRGYLATALAQVGREALAAWLRYGAHPAGPPAVPLTLAEASKRYHIAIPSLAALVAEERIRCRGRRPHGRGESVLFDADELNRDLEALPRCHTARCTAPGTGPSGYCGEHFSEGGRRSVRKLERELLAEGRDWYTAEEAARAAPCSRGTIHRAIKKRELASELIGRTRRIPKDALHEFAKRLPAGRDAGRRKLSPAQLEARRDRVARAHYEGRSPGAIARREGVSKPTVYNDLAARGIDRTGQGRVARVLPPIDRQARKQLHVQLYRADHSLRQVAALTDSSPTQVRRDLADLDEPAREPRRQAKWPMAAERRCEWCGEPFRPRFPAWDTRAGELAPRRFHTDQCAREWRAAQGRAALAMRDLLSVAEAAEEIGVGEHRVLDLIAGRQLKSELVSYPAMLHPVHGIRPAELQRYLRQLAISLNEDGRRAAPLRPEIAVAQARRHGHIAQMVARDNMNLREAEELVRLRAEARRRKLAQLAKGPRGRGETARHRRWAAMFEQLAEGRAESRAQLELGSWDDEQARDLSGLWEDEQARELRDLARRSDLALCREIAEVDWQEHPEDWSRDAYPGAPGDPTRIHPKWLSSAGKVVQMAIKRLQNAGT